MPIWKRTIGPVLRSVTHSGDLQTGTTTQVEWTGSKPVIDRLAAQLNFDGVRFQQGHQQGPVYSITAFYPYEFGANPSPVDIWEVHAEIIQKPIWSKTAVAVEMKAFVDASPGSNSKASYKQGIEQAVEQGKPLTTPNPSTYPQSQKVYNCLTDGADAYEDEYLVLSKTSSVAPQFSGVMTLYSTKLVYTTAQLTAAFSVPAGVLFALPPDPSTVAPGHMWGWRQRQQSLRYVGNRTERVQDWVYNEWDIQLLYSPA